MAGRNNSLRSLLAIARQRPSSICDWSRPKQQLDFLLQQSVREHLLSDVPLGVWLSGGIDSSTILHYAATGSSFAQLKTFSISFRGRSFDESSYIRQAVSTMAPITNELDLNPQAEPGGAIEEFAYYSDEPNADAGALPVWFLSKLSKTTPRWRSAAKARTSCSVDI